MRQQQDFLFLLHSSFSPGQSQPTNTSQLLESWVTAKCSEVLCIHDHCRTIWRPAVLCMSSLMHVLLPILEKDELSSMERGSHKLLQDASAALQQAPGEDTKGWSMYRQNPPLIPITSISQRRPLGLTVMACPSFHSKGFHLCQTY